MEIGALSTFVKEITKIQEDSRLGDYYYFFRGHSNMSYKAMPSLFRVQNWDDKEHILYKRLITESPFEFNNIKSVFDSLVLMQHYSLPTRLLDITTNSLVALYFACLKPNSGKDNNGEVIVFKVPKEEVYYSDDFEVSLISNIAKLPNFYTKNENKDVTKLLGNQVKKEYGELDYEIDENNVNKVLCVFPKLNNTRITRQSGAFFLFGSSLTNKSSWSILDPKWIMENRLIIGKSGKAKLLLELDRNGISNRTLFPDLEHVAKDIKSQLDI